MNCEYARKNYGVPACIGREISYMDRIGIISEDRGNYIGVTFNDETPGKVSNFHPTTEGLEYLGMGTVRKITKAQARYKRYLEYGYGFQNFREFLRWESSSDRSWNRSRT